MNSHDYRHVIRVIIKNSIKKKVPGLKKQILEEVASEIAINVHARLYGAHVEGVASPLWREDYEFLKDFPDVLPKKTAQEILDEPI